MEFIQILLFILAFVIAFAGQIWLVVAGFIKSLIWGFVVLLVPGGNLIFTVLNWEEAKWPALTVAAGVFLTFIAAAQSTQSKGNYEGEWVARDFSDIIVIDGKKIRSELTGESGKIKPQMGNIFVIEGITDRNGGEYDDEKDFLFITDMRMNERMGEKDRVKILFERANLPENAWRVKATRDRHAALQAGEPWTPPKGPADAQRATATAGGPAPSATQPATASGNTVSLPTLSTGSASEQEAVQATFTAFRDAVLRDDGATAAAAVSDTFVEHLRYLKFIALHGHPAPPDQVDPLVQMNVAILRTSSSAETLASETPRNLYQRLISEAMLPKRHLIRAELENIRVDGTEATADLSTTGAAITFDKQSGRWLVSRINVDHLYNRALERNWTGDPLRDQALVSQLYQRATGTPLPAVVWEPLIAQ